MFWNSKETKKSVAAAETAGGVTQRSLNLSDELLEFLQSQTPRDKIDFTLDLTENGLSNRQEYKQSKEVKKYLETNTEDTVKRENCSLVQQRVRDCIQTLSAMKAYKCFQMTELFKDCLAVQGLALKDLGYEKSQSVEQAEAIQGIADDLYVKHYGERGEITNEYQKNNYFHDVNQMKYRMWDSNIRK